MFTVCVLTYGPHTDLATRCLNSLIDTDGYQEVVSEFRIGLNRVNKQTFDFTNDWGKRVVADSGVPVTYFLPIWPHGSPAFKYPVMRAMFREGPNALADKIMWFDDDSYLTGEPQWWDTLHGLADHDTVIGQLWRQPLAEGQWGFFRTQPWFNEKLPPRRIIDFWQGGWWVAKSDFILKHDWPIKELRHNGGDSMFGEMCRHLGVPRESFDHGVRINADSEGRHSKSDRRGLSEKIIGYRFEGGCLPTNHYDGLTFKVWTKHR